MTTPRHITILGDGQMGLVLADALVAAGADLVTLWGRSEDKVRALADSRHSPRLPGFTLPTTVRVTSDIALAFEGATLIVNAVPTQYIRPVWTALEAPAPSVPIVCVAKGIENQRLMLPSAIIADALGDPDASHRICALSGPTIGRELARRLPATMVAAAHDADLAMRVRKAFTTPWLRVYSHDDPIGVEVAGATKNVVALAAGMVDGLGLGNNAKSSVLARGLAEMARLGLALGARTETFFGIAGVGDLATTCFSDSSRNRTCGERLGRGESLEQILGSTASVVEGIATTRSLHELIVDVGVDMPITRAVHAILFDDLTPAAAITGLMTREPKDERIG